MFDLAALSAGAKAIAGLYSALKAVVDVKKDLDVMDKLEEILELRGTLLDAKEEILSLREQLQELEQAMKLAHEMKFDEKIGVYRGADSDGNPLSFCTKCWVEHNRRAPLKLLSSGLGCPTCTTVYQDPGARPPSSPPQSYSLSRPRR